MDIKQSYFDNYSLKYVKSAKVVEVAKPSSASVDDNDNFMFFLIGIIVLAVVVLALIVVIIIVSVACYKKKKANKDSNDCDMIVTDRSVYIVEDSVAMTELSNSQPKSDTQSKPESDVTMIQAFQE